MLVSFLFFNLGGILVMIAGVTNLPMDVLSTPSFSFCQVVSSWGLLWGGLWRLGTIP